MTARKSGSLRRKKRKVRGKNDKTQRKVNAGRMKRKSFVQEKNLYRTDLEGKVWDGMQPRGGGKKFRVAQNGASNILGNGGTLKGSYGRKMEWSPLKRNHFEKGEANGSRIARGTLKDNYRLCLRGDVGKTLTLKEEGKSGGVKPLKE